MLRLSDEQCAAFAAAVRAAVELPMVAHLDALYVRFEQERASRSPRCDQSGRCCRFEAYGHRLFITTLEMARFVQQSGIWSTGSVEAWDGQGCVYQVDGLCGVHLARPFGCRVYFCDPTSTDWQQSQYERFHAEIRELHGRAGVEYLYVEWREGLRALGVLPGADRPGRSLQVLR